jgi:hypothetical protein
VSNPIGTAPRARPLARARAAAAGVGTDSRGPQRRKRREAAARPTGRHPHRARGIVLAAVAAVAALVAGVYATGRAAAPADAPPEAKGSRVVEGGAGLQNGQTVVFYTYWDSAQYRVTADLSLLDAAQSAPVTGSYLGDSSVVSGDETHRWACYEFRHRISDGNPRPDDGGVPIPVVAHNDATGDSTVLDGITVCLLNHPPRHIRTEIIGDARRFRPRQIGERVDTLYTLRDGDSLYIETTWFIGNRPPSIQADFTAIDQFFEIGRRMEHVWLADSSAAAESVLTFGIYYSLSLNAHETSEYPLPIELFIRDAACGVDSVTLAVEMDNDGPAGAPVLDALPNSRRQPELVVTGHAPEGSSDALLLLNGVPQPPATLDAQRAFTDTLTLAPGKNTIVAYGLDEVGNRSEPSETGEVQLVEAAEFSYPQPFAPGDVFSISSPQGWTQLELTLFNLEGDRVMHWRLDGVAYHREITWNGSNEAGDRVRSGPYLARLWTRTESGGTHEEVQALVFQQ